MTVASSKDNESGIDVVMYGRRTVYGAIYPLVHAYCMDGNTISNLEAGNLMVHFDNLSGGIVTHDERVPDMGVDHFAVVLHHPVDWVDSHGTSSNDDLIALGRSVCRGRDSQGLFWLGKP